MTVDYMIGNETYTEEEHEYLIPLKEDFDVCDPERSNNPRDSLRQFTGYGVSFMNFCLPTLSPDVGEYPRIMPLSDVIDVIMALNEGSNKKYHVGDN